MDTNIQDMTESDSAIDTAATATVTPSTPIPAPVPGQRLVVSPAWIEDPLRYKPTMPPPTAVPAVTMITPEVQPVFVHDPTIDVKYVPTMDMSFQSAEDALAFYATYAQLAGFNIRRNRKRNNGRAQDVECSFRGKYTGGPGPDRQRAKTTKKKDCQAMVKITRSTTNNER